MARSLAQNSPSWLPSGVTLTVCAQVDVVAAAVMQPAMAIASVILGIGLSLSAVLRTLVRRSAQAPPLSGTWLLAQLTNVLARDSLGGCARMRKLRALWAGE